MAAAIPGGCAVRAFPLVVRILAVVDVYDALASRRCPRPALAHALEPGTP